MSGIEQRRAWILTEVLVGEVRSWLRCRNPPGIVVT